jgi:hypothetical protein
VYCMCSVTIQTHALKKVTVVAARSVAVQLSICLFSRRPIMWGGKKLRLFIVRNPRLRLSPFMFVVDC